MNGYLSRSMAAVALLAVGCGDPPPPSDGGSLDSGRDGVDAPGLDAAGGDAPVSTGVLVRAAEGGVVTSSDGLFEIHVLPGALASDTTITITRVADAEVPADVRATGPLSAVYSVEPDGLTFGGDGAWGYFTFPTVPAGLVSTDTPPAYSAIELMARSMAGGAVEEHEVPHAFYDADGSFRAYGRLSHLSLQWSAPSRVTYETARLGVDWPAESHAVGTTFGATAVVSAPEEVARSLSFRVTSIPPIAAVSGAGGRESYWLAPPAGMSVPGFEYDVPVLSGTSWPLIPSPTWQCRAVGRSSIYLSSTLSVATGSAPRPHTVEVGRYSECVEEPPVEVSIFDTIHADREGLLGSIGGEPQLEPQVAVRPMTTRTLPLPTATGEPSPWFLRLSPASAPPVTGPATVTATNSGATMTATPNPMTGVYDAVIDDPSIWQPDASTRFDFGGIVTDLMPPSRPVVTFGPVAGIDTEILPMDPGTDLHLGIRIPGVTRCMGEDVRDVIIFRSVDGSSASVPFRLGLELGAALCGRTVEELTAGEFYVDVGTRTSKLVELGAVTSRVTVGHSIELDGRDLLTTCPPGREFCTDACVATNTPMNCGGCGRMPAEICDGLDNNCSGSVDEGCPSRIQWYAGDTATSPTWGEGGGTSSNSQACPYPSVGTAICGSVDTTNGNIRSIRLGCGGASLATDTTVTPYDYSLSITTGSCAGTGGGSSGGTPFELVCPPGTVLDGVNGQAGVYLGQIQIRCATWDVIPLDGGWAVVRVSSSLSELRGTGTGAAFSWIIDNHPVTGFPGVIRYLGGRYEVGADVVSLYFGGGSPFVVRR